MPKTRKNSKKSEDTSKEDELAAERAGDALIEEEEREAQAKAVKEAAKRAKVEERAAAKKEGEEARQRADAEKAAAEKAAAERAATEKAVAEREAAEKAAAKRAVEERAAEAERRAAAEAAAEAAEMEKLKKCCEERDKMMEINQQLQEQLDACNKALTARPDTIESKAASAQHSQEDRPTSSLAVQATSSLAAQTPSNSKRQQKFRLFNTIKHAINIKLGAQSQYYNLTVDGTKIKDHTPKYYINFRPSAIHFPEGDQEEAHITIMPNSNTDDNGSHITIGLPITWTGHNNGKLHIYRNGTFNVKWDRQHVINGRQLAMWPSDNLNILKVPDVEKLYRVLVQNESGLPLEFKAGGRQSHPPNRINFGVNCARCGNIQPGYVNIVNSSRTKNQFITMIKALREFMDIVNEVLNDKKNDIHYILSQQGGKKTRKQRKQRKQKTKGKKSKARKSKRVKRKTRKYK